MSRKPPKIYLKKSHKCYYVKINGVETRLDPDRDKADQLFYEKMAGKRDLGPDPFVRELVDEFLAWAKTHQAAATVEFYRGHLDRFKAVCGGYRVSALKTRHVNQWLDTRYEGNSNGSTRNGAVRAVKRVFSWAVDEERIERKPLASLKAPKPTRRDSCLTESQWEAIKAVAKAPLLDLLIVLHETGCRPQEARMVEARHVASGRWVFPVAENKTGHQTGEVRIVRLTDKALEITTRLVAEYPEGPLFRNHRKKRWTKNALIQALGRLEMPFKVTPYSFRHGWAVESLRRDVKPGHVRELMGHTRASRVLEQYYTHNDDEDELAAALKQATDKPDDAA